MEECRRFENVVSSASAEAWVAGPRMPLVVFLLVFGVALFSAGSSYAAQPTEAAQDGYVMLSLAMVH